MTVHRSTIEAVTEQSYPSLTEAQAAGDTLTGVEFVWIYQHRDGFIVSTMPVVEIGYTRVALKHIGEPWKAQRG